jgi:uncharacterized damage-inducible protein DinB
MSDPTQTTRHVEVWMLGPLPGVAPLLQPVAHTLTECREEVRTKCVNLSPAELWTAHGGAASAGFHIRHAAGALDRLFTYARGESLSDEQFRRLEMERAPDLADGAAERLVAAFDAQVERALAQVRATDEATLLEARVVGRSQLPSNVLGLLFHAAEHTQRHVGQFVTTVRLVRVFTQ